LEDFRKTIASKVELRRDDHHIHQNVESGSYVHPLGTGRGFRTGDVGKRDHLRLRADHSFTKPPKRSAKTMVKVHPQMVGEPANCTRGRGRTKASSTSRPSRVPETLLCYDLSLVGLTGDLCTPREWIEGGS
jgi:hypothetical protein